MKAPLHPQSVEGQPRALRWVSDTGSIPVGRVVSAPGTLGPLFEYGVLTKGFVERRGVWTWLGDTLSWAEHGPRVRDALGAALGMDGWEIDAGGAELLTLIARDILEGELKSYIASHGGVITVAGATETTLTLDFGGACAHCPAAGSTLHDRIESAVMARYPMLERVDRVDEGAEAAPKGWLGLPILRRG